MQKVSINIIKCDHFDDNLALPHYSTEGAAGADIRACLGIDEKICIKPGERTLIATGLVFEIPDGYEMQIRPRSGLSLKTGLMVVNSPGTIDADYRGEVKVILGNLGTSDEIISHGDRIAQLIIAPVLQADFCVTKNISSTKRGSGGFGHTGRE